MKEITTQIIQYLKKNIPRKQLNVPKKDFSPKSIEMISSIFLKMVEAETHYNKIKMNESWLDFDKTATSLPKGVDYNYSPEHARTEIDEIHKMGCCYSFDLRGRKITVSIVAPKQDGVSHKKHFNDVIKRIFMWLYVSTHYAATQCSRELNIYLYLTNLKKCIPDSRSTIKQENANTGFTTTCNTKSEIHLYRDEEWFKVLIHETFHNLGLDFSGSKETSLNACVFSIFPIKTDMRIYETYCEMWAEIINVMFISYFLKNNSSYVENIDKKIALMTQYSIKLLEKEQEFSLFQCAKVLHLFGMDYQDLYDNSQTAQHARIHKYKEETPVLSYYVIKSIMMFFISDYINWCVTHNNSSLNFNKSKKNLDSYCVFIREHYCNIKYLSSIKIYENWFKKTSNKKKDIDEITILKTLRMSLHEI